MRRNRGIINQKGVLSFIVYIDNQSRPIRDPTHSLYYALFNLCSVIQRESESSNKLSVHQFSKTKHTQKKHDIKIFGMHIKHFSCTSCAERLIKESRFIWNAYLRACVRVFALARTASARFRRFECMNRKTVVVLFRKNRNTVEWRWRSLRYGFRYTHTQNHHLDEKVACIHSHPINIFSMTRNNVT